MFHAYVWYAWGFGRWIDSGEFKTLNEALAAVKTPTATYKVEHNGKIVAKRIDTHFRYGMSVPHGI